MVYSADLVVFAFPSSPTNRASSSSRELATLHNFGDDRSACVTAHDNIYGNSSIGIECV